MCKCSPTSLTANDSKSPSQEIQPHANCFPTRPFGFERKLWCCFRYTLLMFQIFPHSFAKTLIPVSSYCKCSSELRYPASTTSRLEVVQDHSLGFPCTWGWRLFARKEWKFWTWVLWSFLIISLDSPAVGMALSGAESKGPEEDTLGTSICVVLSVGVRPGAPHCVLVFFPIEMFKQRENPHYNLDFDLPKPGCGQGLCVYAYTLIHRICVRVCVCIHVCVTGSNLVPDVIPLILHSIVYLSACNQYRCIKKNTALYCSIFF